MTKVFSAVYGKNLKYCNLCEKYRVISIPFGMVSRFWAQYHIKYHTFLTRRYKIYYRNIVIRDFRGV